MSDLLFSIGQSVCEVATMIDVASGGCYNPSEMNVLGAAFLGLAGLAVGMWALMRG